METIPIVTPLPFQSTYGCKESVCTNLDRPSGTLMRQSVRAKSTQKHLSQTNDVSFLLNCMPLHDPIPTIPVSSCISELSYLFLISYSTLVVQKSADHSVHTLLPNEGVMAKANSPQALEDPKLPVCRHDTYDGGAQIESG